MSPHQSAAVMAVAAAVAVAAAAAAEAADVEAATSLADHRSTVDGTTEGHLAAMTDAARVGVGVGAKEATQFRPALRLRRLSVTSRGRRLRTSWPSCLREPRSQTFA